MGGQFLLGWYTAVELLSPPCEMVDDTTRNEWRDLLNDQRCNNEWTITTWFGHTEKFCELALRLVDHTDRKDTGTGYGKIGLKKVIHNIRCSLVVEG
jgi:hypothetical protein